MGAIGGAAVRRGPSLSLTAKNQFRPERAPSQNGLCFVTKDVGRDLFSDSRQTDRQTQEKIRHKPGGYTVYDGMKMMVMME
jgi:hypothetical protein